MDNIIEFNASPNNAQSQAGCWLCQRPTSLRAFFCQHCGTIQPVRVMDHFTRLGLDRRIDIDSEVLERQYKGLKKVLDPERFVIRGLGERSHAAQQLEALNEAYHTLREPLRRGRYWLVLHERESAQTEETNPMVGELKVELENAVVAPQCDKIAQKAGNAMEQGIVGLMQALRSQNWQLANAILLEVDGLETLLKDVRGRRTALAGQTCSSGDALTSVK